MSDLFERPAVAHAPVSVILVAHDAGFDVVEIVTAWAEFLDAMIRPYEILLVDDGSLDDTPRQAELLAQRFPRLRNLRHDSRQGLGASLRTGIATAQNPLVCTCPCDKQFHPSDLRKALETIDQVDMVTGYRVGLPLPPWLRLWDGLRRLLGRLLLGAAAEPRQSWVGCPGWRRRWAARWLFGLRVQDPECPLRLYRREVLRRFPIQCDSSAALIEILAKANHLECLMAEVPVTWIPPKEQAHEAGEPAAAAELRRLFFAPDFGPVPAPPSEEPMPDYQI